MDHAVALVQAYLQANGYFTVTEYPVLAAMPGGGYQSATDVDVLALRLCQAGASSRAGERGVDAFAADPALAVPDGRADLLVVEVKEGRAELNKGAKDREVLLAVLTRFGLEAHPRVDRSLRELERRGETKWPDETWVRMVAFGSTVRPHSSAGFARSRSRTSRGISRRTSTTTGMRCDTRRSGSRPLGFMALLEQMGRSRPDGADPAG